METAAENERCIACPRCRSKYYRSSVNLFSTSRGTAEAPTLESVRR
jgi:hypothetical protein